MKKSIVTTMALMAMMMMGLMVNDAAADGASGRHVVNVDQVQARIDQQSAGEQASRDAIQTMLQRPEVRSLAGQAGLDITRASAAASILSGAELATMAAQANEINSDIGGDSVVLTTTAIIIILLILILLLN